MNTIQEACDRIKEYLTDWYVKNKDVREHLKDVNTSYAKNLNGSSLYDAKQEFIKTNPEYKKYDFNIHVGFDVDGDTWRPGCMDGCCLTRATCRGVYAVPIDWEQTRNLALKESKTLKLIRNLSK